MKVGILSLTNTINYGALLQAYALQKTINALGIDNEIIDYRNEEVSKVEFNSFSFSPKWLIRMLIIGRASKNKKKKFDHFEAKYIQKSPMVYRSDIDTLNSNYDKFVVGSDQVWNLKITGHDMTFFLDFAGKNKNKIAYAPSLGEYEYNEEDKMTVAKLLIQFNALSIRETKPLNVLKELSRKNVELVLDPTLLVERTHWASIAVAPKFDTDYILVYLPHNKGNVFKSARKLQEKTGLPIVYLSISPRIIRGVRTIYDASPEEFLGWIMHAKYVLTGSFHGLAFSLIFNKDFFYEAVGTRIINLANISGTVDRNLENLTLSPIDYKATDEKLIKLRGKSLCWLKESLYEK